MAVVLSILEQQAQRELQDRLHKHLGAVVHRVLQNRNGLQNQILDFRV